MYLVIRVASPNDSALAMIPLPVRESRESPSQQQRIDTVRRKVTTASPGVRAQYMISKHQEPLDSLRQFYD